MGNGIDFRKLALDLRGQLTTAQSELAVLREELADREADVKAHAGRRAAAEQRNVTLREALEDLLKGSGSSPGSNKRYAKARAALEASDAKN